MGLERWVRTLPLRLRALVRRRDADLDLDEELRFHLDQQVADLVQRGMAPAEARTIALRALGGMERRKDEMRDARRTGVAENLWRDVRYAARTLRRSPGFTVVAMLTLAIGIGANTAIFTLVNAILLRPLGYAAPLRLVAIQYEHSETVAPATFLDWQSASHSFEKMGLAEYWTPTLTGGDHAEQLDALHVSPDLIELLGVKPIIGRLFLPGEDGVGRGHVLLLGYGVWKTRFAGDSTIIGKPVRLDGESYQVVGVMPRDFVFAPYWAAGQIWAPFPLDERRTDRAGESTRVMGRLAPGVTLEAARSEIATIAARLEREYPGTNQHVTVIPLQEKVVGSVETPLTILLVAVGCVLLIACANVAHLQLMRAAAREREFALRTALGGSAGRLVQQSLVESLMLSLAGAIPGFALAVLGIRGLIALAPPGLPRLDGVSMDARVFLFMLGVTVLAAVVCGVAPALASTRVDVQASLKEGGRGAADGPRRGRLRALLVVSEFAMALVLLVGAGLVLRSFGALLRVDPGFDATRTVSMTVALKGTAHGEPALRLAFFADLIERVKALPGVQDASAINHVPLNGDDWWFPVYAEGHALPKPGEEPRAQFLVVRPGYLRTMGIGLRLGRDITDQDAATSSHVVVINEQFAERIWPRENPLGRRISVDDAGAHPDWFTVIGVARDVKQGSFTQAMPAMYFPSFLGGSYPWKAHPLISLLDPDYMTLVVRSTGNPSALVPAISSLVREMDRDAPVGNVITMDAAVARQFTAPRFYLLLLGLFAGIAVLLAAIGVYGVISYSVARRSHEIGVRLALGAGRAEAFKLVV
ncbi:MAG TPA: ABC transporter permease, partial [Gemmatimonadales bacterium]